MAMATMTKMPGLRRLQQHRFRISMLPQRRYNQAIASEASSTSHHRLRQMCHSPRPSQHCFFGNHQQRETNAHNCTSPLIKNIHVHLRRNLSTSSLPPSGQKRTSGEGGSHWRRKIQPKKLNKFGHAYAQVGGPIDPSICSLTEDEIHNLIRTRDKYRRTRNFRMSDSVRDELNKCGVDIDDKLNQWRADATYSRVGSAIDSSICSLNESEINNLIRERIKCRHTRNFQRADAIMKELNSCGVLIDDNTREWWVGEKRKLKNMNDCLSLEEAIEAMHGHLDKASPRNLSAFWAAVPKFLQRTGNTFGSLDSRAADQQLGAILTTTLGKIESFAYRDLAATALGFAKIVKNVDRYGNELPEGSPRKILHELLIANESEYKQRIFFPIATAAMSIIQDFDARHLANLSYAYAIVDCVPKFKDGNTLLDHIADKSIPLLGTFKSQELSAILWAYSTLEISSPLFFKQAGEAITAHDSLISFTPQALSNIVLAYASAHESHPRLFEKVADHIIGLDSLASFTPQALSNIVWSYATAREQNPDLFKKIAHHIVELGSLESFKPQDHSVIPWAFATSGHIDKILFNFLAPAAADILSQCNSQGLANIAWSYAVANVTAPMLFNDRFVNACVEKKSVFGHDEMLQLHQWKIWQDELKSNVRLPSSFQADCYKSFLSRQPEPSALQNDVISELSSIGLEPEFEKLTEIGYRLDALVKVNGENIGIEVDGPIHFIGKNPTGKTILKRRQVSCVEGIQVKSVPYWEWNQLGNNRNDKQQYLREMLGLI